MSKFIKLTLRDSGRTIAIDATRVSKIREFKEGGCVVVGHEVNCEVSQSIDEILALIGGEAFEAKAEHSHDWCSCPICGEPDMRRDIYPDPECGFNSLIHCTNHACASNKAIGYSMIVEKASNP